jgi:hypothetical protein
MTKAFYLPSNFEKDLKSKVWAKSSIVDWHKPIHFDKLLYVVSILGSEVGGYREDNKGWIPLKKSYLDKVIQSRFSTKALTTLIDLMIIEREESYITEGLLSGVNGRSKRYRLCEPYLSLPQEIIKRPSKVLEKSSKVDANYIKALSKRPLGATYRFLHRNHSALGFREGVKEWIESLPCKTNKDRTKINKRLAIMDRVERGDYRLKENNGRVYSVLTQMPSDLRNWLLLDGEEVGIIDIKNSQPFFFLNLLYPRPMDSEEAGAYAEAVGTGEFYETLEGACRRSYMDRSALKEQVFKQVLYGRHNYNRKPLWDAFEKLFPSAALKVKRMRRDHQREPEKHKHPAVKMSAKEARVIIGGFVNQMRLSGVNYPLLTIHDCLVAPWSACKELEEAFRDYLEGEIGLRPTTKMEWLTP